jgi:hypothetical protein
MLFSTPLRYVKKSTGLSAPLCKTRAGLGHPWPTPSRILRRRRLIMGHYQTHALATPRPRPPPGGSPPGSALHNKTLCKLPLRQAPPRHASHDRPSRAFVASSNFSVHQRFLGASHPAAPTVTPLASLRGLPKKMWSNFVIHKISPRVCFRLLVQVSLFM